jgi:hypothetical protein
VHETFARIGIFGGFVQESGFPAGGMLNNPDPVGALVTALLQPWVGRASAYNALILLQLGLNVVAARALAREIVGTRIAAWTAAIAYGWSPLALSYGVSSAVTDTLNLWPYPLTILFALRGVRQRSWISGGLAGGIAGLGFISCPYNAVLFGIGLIPLLFWKPVAGASWRPILPSFLLAAGVLVGAYAGWMSHLMADSSSQMSQQLVDSTRHHWPYPYLQPGGVDRYYSTLSDYVLLGKNSVILRNTGSSFFRSVGPGYGVLSLCVLALTLRHRRVAGQKYWSACVAFSVAASTGPYFAVADGWALPWPANPAWLLPHWIVPGASLLLEPFRYGLPASLGFAMVAAIGTAALMDHFGRWCGYLIPMLLGLELWTLGPFPFPSTVPQDSSPLVAALARLPDGAILRFPYYFRGTSRFCRWHFYEQLLHRRPIADQPAGFPSQYLLENAFTFALLQAEHADVLPLVGAENGSLEDGIRNLRADGFVALVVDPDRYSSRATREEAAQILRYLPDPDEVDGYEVYRFAEK